MIRITILAFLVIFMVHPVVKAQQKSLFNGKDLSGWTAYGTEKWYVEDGFLICESGPDKKYGYLATNKHYKNFELQLDLLRTKPGNIEKNPKNKLMQSLSDKWASSVDLQMRYSSRRKYIIEELGDDPEMKRASQILATYSPEDIINAFKNAKNHLSQCSHTLITCHQSKGMTWDSVTLDNSVDNSIEDIIEKIKLKEPLKDEEIQELNLYFVSVSRQRHELHNAKWLDRIHKMQSQE